MKYNLKEEDGNARIKGVLESRLNEKMQGKLFCQTSEIRKSV